MSIKYLQAHDVYFIVLSSTYQKGLKRGNFYTQVLCMEISTDRSKAWRFQQTGVKSSMTWFYKRDKRMYGRKPDWCEGIKSRF